MPFLHRICKTDHYNSNKTVKIKPREGYIPILTKKGTLYEGYWHLNNREGFGVLAKNFEKCKSFKPKYRGDWLLDKRDGNGNGYYKDGGYYVGEWKRGMRYGYGKMWYADGSFYAGDWKCDQRWGEGLFVEVTGDRYEGMYYKDMRHGLGRWYHLSTGQMQEGAWINDESVTSTMEDIPFRQTAVFPTEYPIQEIELQAPIKVIEQAYKTHFRSREECRSLYLKLGRMTINVSKVSISDIAELKEKIKYI